eukprot:1123316-Pyramimonas_sp.AAC.1
MIRTTNEDAADLVNSPIDRTARSIQAKVHRHPPSRICSFCGLDCAPWSVPRALISLPTSSAHCPGARVLRHVCMRMTVDAVLVVRPLLTYSTTKSAS